MHGIRDLRTIVFFIFTLHLLINITIVSSLGDFVVKLIQKLKCSLKRENWFQILLVQTVNLSFKIHENKRLQILVKITNTGKLLIQYWHLNRTLML